jgi:hypothetical protein
VVETKEGTVYAKRENSGVVTCTFQPAERKERVMAILHRVAKLFEAGEVE